MRKRGSDAFYKEVIADANARDFSLKTRRKFIEKVKRKCHEVESYPTQRREESFH